MGQYAAVRGDSASEFTEADITDNCSPEPDVSISDSVRIGTRFEFAIIGSGSIVEVSYDERGVETDDDSYADSAEEEDDLVEDAEVGVLVVAINPIVL